MRLRFLFRERYCLGYPENGCANRIILNVSNLIFVQITEISFTKNAGNGIVCIAFPEGADCAFRVEHRKRISFFSFLKGFRKECFSGYCGKKPIA